MFVHRLGQVVCDANYKKMTQLKFEKFLSIYSLFLSHLLTFSLLLIVLLLILFMRMCFDNCANKL